MDDDIFPGQGPASQQGREQQPHTFHNAVMAYIPFLCFVALFNHDSDEYTRNHGKQGLILLIVEIIAVLLLIIGKYFWTAVLLICLGFSIAGLVNAFSGKPFTLPFIGRWADKF